MVSRSSQYQCLLWAPNVHCFEWCALSVTLGPSVALLSSSFASALSACRQPWMVKCEVKRSEIPTRQSSVTHAAPPPLSIMASFAAIDASGAAFDDRPHF